MVCIFDENANQYQSMTVCSFKLPLQSPQLPTGRFFVAVFTTHSLMLYHHFSLGSSWTKDGCFAGRSERAVSAGRWSQNSFDGGERGGRLVTSGAMALEISDSLPEKKNISVNIHHAISSENTENMSHQSDHLRRTNWSNSISFHEIKSSIVFIHHLNLMAWNNILSLLGPTAPPYYFQVRI